MAKRKSIPAERWQWFGNAAHFICGDKCRFHMATMVGKYLISTVGEYFPPGCELPPLSFGLEIGCGRKFETFVFYAGRQCDTPACGCGMPAIRGAEIETNSANTRRDARNNHMAMCRKYARKG